MELNLDTLTKKQREQIRLWYNIYLNEDNKLVTEEPTTPYSEEYISYKNNLLKEDCRKEILTEYSETDQRNALMSWDATKITEMNTFIQEKIENYKVLKI